VTDHYAVMGNPVAHSKSPLIHAAFARQTQQDLDYQAILVALDGFDAAVADFFRAGGKGLNITVPFKQAAWQLAEVLSDHARLAEAVNTLLIDAEGRLSGHNTDGPGLVRDITINHAGRLTNKRILVLGAGGATRGILQPLLEAQPAALVVANRTRSKAETLAGIFHDLGNISACGLDDLAGESFDWVINATAASLQGELPVLPDGVLRPGAWCYDLMYAKEPTVFCRWATGAGAAQVIDGLGMLVEQAAEAFQLWRGVRPDTRELLQQLRN
jgi:shikimate dehydrogenase